MDSDTHSLTEATDTIPAPQRRKKYTTQQKQAIVGKTFTSGQSVSVVARQHGLAPSQLYQWRKAMQEGARVGVDAEEGVVSKAEFKKLQARARELQRLLGMKTEEVECLKEAVRIGREKKLISRAPLFGIEGFQ